jgi:CBS domain-containing protein
MPLSDVMAIKTVNVDPGVPASKVAEQMIAAKVGSALVCDGPTLRGIITERDILRVVADGRDPASVRAGECMTPDPVCAGPDWDIEDAARLMLQRGIRHLPVTQEGNVVGVVSIRDLVRFGVAALGRGHERSKEILEAAGG